MSSSNHYDETLLGAAPVATRAQLQEGYNVDLLGAKTSPPTLTPRGTDLEADKSKELYAGVDEASASHTPFLHSTKGKIIILIAAIIIVGAIVGGAVGGTVGKPHQHQSVVNSTTGNGEAGDSSTTSPIMTTAATAQGAGTDSQTLSGIKSQFSVVAGGATSTSSPPGVNVEATQGISGGPRRRR